jgi:hypothetical protein
VHFDAVTKRDPTIPPDAIAARVKRRGRRSFDGLRPSCAPIVMLKRSDGRRKSRTGAAASDDPQDDQG